MSKTVDLSGQRFGSLIVIRRVKSDDTHKGQASWLCKCDCGNELITTTKRLHNGKHSCGCVMGNTKHGDNTRKRGATRLYGVWKAMRQRCNNPNTPAYDRYGGRGISVCDEWSNYQRFKEWALTNGYAEGLTIDRIDNDAGYYPWNCRWVTRKEQSRNRSCNVLVTINGDTKPLSVWCEEMHLNENVVNNRIYNLHWSYEDAITKPVRCLKVKQG